MNELRKKVFNHKFGAKECMRWKASCPIGGVVFTVKPRTDGKRIFVRLEYRFASTNGFKSQPERLHDDCWLLNQPCGEFTDNTEGHRIWPLLQSFWLDHNHDAIFDKLTSLFADKFDEVSL